MNPMPKVAFIGAGSTVFAKNLMGDILSYDELADTEISLMDIDPERLEVSLKVGQKVNQALGRNAKISACAVGSFDCSRVLCASATSSPRRATAQPTGTSPSSRARLASSSARRIHSMSPRTIVRVVRPTGIEPVTYGSVDRHSIQLSYGRTVLIVLHFLLHASARRVRKAGQATRASGRFGYNSE